MEKHKHRFESEVQLGLLVIVFILLFLNFASNFIIFRDRESRRDVTAGELNSAALSVTRVVQGVVPPRLNDAQRRDLMLRHNLSGLMLIPFRPPDNTNESKKRWFGSIIRNLPPGQIPGLAHKLLASEYQTLTRGENDEYFYVYPITSGTGKSLVILSKNVPELAYLDDSGRVLLIIGIVSAIAIAGIYFFLLRFIFSPFRKIKKQAIAAGRVVDQTKDDVEAMVEDYHKIIDELKKKEAQLLKLNKAIQSKADSLEQFNRYLLTSMNSGIVTVDKQGQILSINRAAAEVLAVDPVKYTGRSFKELLDFSSELTDAVRFTLVEGKNLEYRETDFIGRDGQKQTLGVSVSVICDNLNKPIGASFLLNDLTELRRLRSELETKNRLAALGEMSGGLAHQLRNSMGAITGYCNLLKKRLKKNSLEIGNITALIQEVTEAEKLVDRFLQFSRPLAYRPQVVSVNEFVAQVTHAFQARPDCRQIEFVVRSVDDNTIEMDPLLIKQALTNLLENAVNAYKDRDGQVEIRLSKCRAGISDTYQSSEVEQESGTPSLLQIEVEDSGCGIAEEDLDRIFTPFFSSRPSGTGLGLPLARKIIDLHQGSLTVRSQLGNGTTFTISLPIRSQSQDQVINTRPSLASQT